MEADRDYEDTVITSVEEDGKGWVITQDLGSFYVSKEYGVEPKVGSAARFYPGGLGRAVRGLVIDGQTVYYRTAAEQQAKFEAEMERHDQESRARFEAVRTDHDRRIAALPDVFQRRLGKFQAGNPDFRWKHEGYELLCCEQAVLFAYALKTPEAVVAFGKANNDEQQQMVQGIDGGHSGNSFAFSCRLAYEYLTDPALVVAEHGALTILVGCDDYGCKHPSPAD